MVFRNAKKLPSIRVLWANFWPVIVLAFGFTHVDSSVSLSFMIVLLSRANVP